MKFQVLIPVGLLLAMTGPALAVSYCYDNNSSLSVTINGNAVDQFGRPSNFDEELENLAKLKELQRRGVDATSVEDWNGCIRAFVRQPGGGEIMEYYDPNSFEKLN